jgi:conjugative transposon TraM protein
MEQTKHSPKFLRQRKFLTIMPLLVLPFLTLMFWALGGGKVTKAEAQATVGLNKELPGVHLKEDQPLDKMSYYNQAAIDSAKLKELKKNDPYYKAVQDTGKGMSVDEQRLGFNGAPYMNQGAVGNSAYKGLGYNDPNEQKVYQKLNQLNNALAQSTDPQASSYGNSNNPNFNGNRNAGVNSSDVDRLEKMMQTMQQGSGADPEMTQLTGMLEKIQEIQNPGIAQEKLRQTSELRKGRVYAVTTGKKVDPVSSLDKESGKFSFEDTALKLSNQQNGFFSFDNMPAGNATQNAIEAVVHETQTIVNGATVKLRLTSDIFINGQLIPKDNFIYGTAALAGERLEIKIAGVRYNNNLFPVELAVFDLDGLAGIYIPGAISRDVAKESTDRGLQNLGFNSLDPSIGMQAASMGVEAAKSFLSKKVKLIRVTVKAGYQVLLRDEKQKQEN